MDRNVKPVISVEPGRRAAVVKRNHDRRRGVTLIEVLVALAVLCIALIPLFPALAQAGRDAAYARQGYIAQLQAQSLMLAVRDALAEGADAPARAAACMAGSASHYGYWHTGGETCLSPGAPDLQVTGGVEGWPGTLVIAVVWDAEGRVAGRAAGMMPGE